MVKNFLDKLKDRFSKKNDSSAGAQSEDGENLSIENLPPALQKAIQLEKSTNSNEPLSEDDSQNFSYEEIQAPHSDSQNIAEEPIDQTQSKINWHSKVQNQLRSKLNTLSWRFSRRNDDVTTNFKLPFAQSNLRFEELGHIFFAPKFRPLIHRIFLISLAVAVPYTAGKMLALFVSPTVELKTPAPRPAMAEFTEAPNYKEQMDRVRLVNLFNATSSEGGPGAKKGPFICEKSDKKTSLPIKLVNTIVLQDSIKSIAAVQVRGSMDAVTLREGDPVESVGQISKIEPMRILIKNTESGECEYAENEERVRDQMSNRRFNVLSPKAGKQLMASKMNEGIRNVGNHFFIKKALREEAVKDMNNILTQARALQIRNPDGSYSFKMTEIIPGSVYSKLNIHDGDVISGINGKKIENINELMNMFGKIKDIDNMSLTLTREGQEQTLEYEFE